MGRNVDTSLLRHRLDELVVARTGASPIDPASASGSARVLGLHPLLSVAVSLAWRNNPDYGGSTTPNGATWTISALARNDQNKDMIVLSGSPLVNVQLLPDGFETASAAPGLQIDFTVSANGQANGEIGDWVLSLEAAPVDAELLMKYPELLHALYAKLQLVPLQRQITLVFPG